MCIRDSPRTDTCSKCDLFQAKKSLEAELLIAKEDSVIITATHSEFRRFSKIKEINADRKIHILQANS